MTHLVTYNFDTYTPFQKRIYNFRASQMIRLVRQEPLDHANNGKLVWDALRQT